MTGERGRERKGGRERKREREKEEGKKNSLLSSRRVWQDSKFLKTVRVHVERGQGRGWCTSEFAAIRDVRRGRETCLSKSLLERRMVGRSVGRLAARKQPLLQQTHPATFVPPQNLPPKLPQEKPRERNEGKDLNKRQNLLISQLLLRR